MSIRAHIRENPVTVERSTSVRDAAKQMATQNAGFVVAVGDGDRPLGVLTDRDIAMRVLRRGLDPDEVPVGDLMGDELIYVGESASITNAMRRMRAHGVRRLPVVDAAGALVGVFDWNDAVGIISGELRQVARVAGQSA